MVERQTDYTIMEGYELPSKGKIYAENVNPHIELRSMTARDEMKRLSPSSTPLKTLADIIEDCFIEKPAIHVYDMCLGDYEYLLHRLRIVTYGDSYKSVCNGHDHGSSSTTVTIPSSCDNYTATYYCSGHSVEACFGHKDIEVTVTTIFMEQMFESNELPTSSTGAHYSSYWTRLSKFKLNTEAWNSGWTENYIAWANSLYNQNWTTLYGIDP